MLFWSEQFRRFRRAFVLCEKFRRSKAAGPPLGWELAMAGRRNSSSSSAMCLFFFHATDASALDTTSLASDHLGEHVLRHHQLGKSKGASNGASNMSGSSERSGCLRSKIQTWSLVFLWTRIRQDLEIQRRTTISSICR